MQSSIKQAKVDLEVYLQANWKDTPIQFEGVHFNSEHSWIAPVFRPVEATKLTSHRSIQEFELSVFCYEQNPTKCYDLMDRVITALECKQVGSVYIEAGDFDGLGCQSFDNGLYEVRVIFKVTRK